MTKYLAQVYNISVVSCQFVQKIETLSRTEVIAEASNCSHKWHFWKFDKKPGDSIYRH